MRRQKCKTSIPVFFLSVVLTIAFILIPLSLYSKTDFAASRGVHASLSLVGSWQDGTNSVYQYSVTVSFTRDGTISYWDTAVTLPYTGTITNFWSSNNITYSLSGTTLTLATTDPVNLSKNQSCTGIGFILSVPSSTPSPTSTPTPTVTSTPIPPTNTPTPSPTDTPPPPTDTPPTTTTETTTTVTVATPTPSPTPKPKKTPTPKPAEETTTETIAVTEPSETTSLPSETTLATVVAVMDTTQNTSATETTTPTPSPTPLTGVLGAAIAKDPTNTGNDSFNWLPIVITAFVLFLLFLLIKREKDGKKTPVFSPLAEQVSDSWKNKVVPAFAEYKKMIPFINQANSSASTAMPSPPVVNEPYAAASRFRPIPKSAPAATSAFSTSATITDLSAQKESQPTFLPPQVASQAASQATSDPYAAARGLRPLPKMPNVSPQAPVTTVNATPPAHSKQAASDPYAAARGLRPPTKADMDLPKHKNDIG